MGRAVRIAGALGIMMSRTAVAQTAPPENAGPPPQAQPPQGQPPPGYGYPPPGYGYPPPGYGYAPPPNQPPHWEPGDPAPPGYHVEEKPRTGLVIAGAITLGVPYVIGLSFASSYNFGNSSALLIVPGIGPWLTLALHKDRCGSSSIESGFDCMNDGFVRAYLTIDGIAQTTGAILLILGIAAKKEHLVRDQSAIVVTPVQMGRDGHGLAVIGRF